VPDVYIDIAQAAPPILDGLMAALELRAADRQLSAMLAAYLADASLPAGARVLEVGCGTGAITRAVAEWPGVVEAVGVDPSPVFVAKARELVGDRSSPTFQTADGRSLPFPDASFDAVIFHTTLCHVPEPDIMLAEAVRVLRAGGCVAIFEGDYAGATLATRPDDPLERCADAFRQHFVHDPWLARRLPGLARAAGLRSESVRNHGYVESLAPGFMLRSWVDMGADALAASGAASKDEAEGLKAEARRRIASGEHFGHIAYVSLVARKPA
jgi:ubiquinone/menaquinone biosynthesis C-methylase UbiE